MRCDHSDEQKAETLALFAKARCAHRPGACGGEPAVLFVEFAGNYGTSAGICVTASCLRHRRAVRRQVEASHGEDRWLGVAEVPPEQISGLVEWFHGPSEMCHSFSMGLTVGGRTDSA